MTARFPAWANRVTYWQIHDIDLMAPPEALTLIGQAMERLVEESSRFVIQKELLTRSQ